MGGIIRLYLKNGLKRKIHEGLTLVGKDLKSTNIGSENLPSRAIIKVITSYIAAKCLCF